MAPGPHMGLAAGRRLGRTAGILAAAGIAGRVLGSRIDSVAGCRNSLAVLADRLGRRRRWVGGRREELRFAVSVR